MTGDKDTAPRRHGCVVTLTKETRAWHYRVKAGMSQEKAAEEAGVHKRTMQRYEVEWLDKGWVTCQRTKGGPKVLKDTGKRGGGRGEDGRGTPGGPLLTASRPSGVGRWHGLPLKMDLDMDGGTPEDLRLAGHHVERTFQDYYNGTRVVRWATWVPVELPDQMGMLKVQFQKGPASFTLQVHASMRVADSDVPEEDVAALEAWHIEKVQEGIDLLLEGTDIRPVSKLYKRAAKKLEIARRAKPDAPVGGDVQRLGGGVDRSKDPMKDHPVESEVSLPVMVAIRNEVKEQSTELEKALELLREGQGRLERLMIDMTHSTADQFQQLAVITEELDRRTKA